MTRWLAGLSDERRVSRADRPSGRRRPSEGFGHDRFGGQRRRGVDHRPGRREAVLAGAAGVAALSAGRGRLQHCLHGGSPMAVGVVIGPQVLCSSAGDAPKQGRDLRGRLDGRARDRRGRGATLRGAASRCFSRLDGRAAAGEAAALVTAAGRCRRR